MRSVFNERIIGKLEQGSIINFCRAIDYKEREVHGIIITPRCDLSHSKVNTVHYLPVIELKDWINVDFWNIFSSRVKAEVKQKIKGILERNNLSYNLFEMFSTESLIEKLESLIKKQMDYKDLCSNIEKYTKLKLEDTGTYSDFKKKTIKEFPKISQGIFKELKENRLKEFYLIENWEKQHSYNIVLMREVGTLKFDFAQKIAEGLNGSLIQPGDFIYNSIENVNNECFLCTIATLKSPFIEHLIQHFFLNFGRIGITDHPRDIETEFYNLLIQ